MNQERFRLFPEGQRDTLLTTWRDVYNFLRKENIRSGNVVEVPFPSEKDCVCPELFFDRSWVGGIALKVFWHPVLEITPICHFNPPSNAGWVTYKQDPAVALFGWRTRHDSNPCGEIPLSTSKYKATFARYAGPILADMYHKLQDMSESRPGLTLPIPSKYLLRCLETLEEFSQIETTDPFIREKCWKYFRRIVESENTLVEIAELAQWFESRDYDALRFYLRGVLEENTYTRRKV